MKNLKQYNLMCTSCKTTTEKENKNWAASHELCETLPTTTMIEVSNYLGSRDNQTAMWPHQRTKAP
jgi:hypothetical protein